MLKHQCTKQKNKCELPFLLENIQGCRGNIINGGERDIGKEPHMEMRHKWVRCPGRLASWEQDCGSNMHAGGFWGCKGNSLDHTVHEEGAFLKIVSPSTPWFVGIDDPQDGPRTYLLLPALKFVVLVFECMDWKGMFLPFCSAHLCVCVWGCARMCTRA